MILGHLDEDAPWTPGALASHMGVAPSTMTETIDRLERLGHVERARRGRETEVRLTAKGAEAMAASSVLDAGRVRDLLARLAPGDRRRAIEGLALLAAAADARGREVAP
jgi:DNA-binding MarR family transcriptional regulator